MNRTLLDTLLRSLHHRVHRRAFLKSGVSGLAQTFLLARLPMFARSSSPALTNTSRSVELRKGDLRGCFAVLFRKNPVVRNACVLVETESGSFSTRDDRFTLIEKSNIDTLQLDL
jgi:hypothetical protein